MIEKEHMKIRLHRKTVKELKAIYIRIAGHDLLRGTKPEMVNVLYSLLTARRYWAAISGSKI